MATGSAGSTEERIGGSSSGPICIPGSSALAERERLTYVRNHYGQWFDPIHGAEALPGIGLTQSSSEFKATSPGTVSRTWKVHPLSAADIARLADHLITFSYEAFGG